MSIIFQHQLHRPPLLTSREPTPPRTSNTHHAKHPKHASNKFKRMMFFAFFARTEPAQSMAKPACIKNTRYPENSVKPAWHTWVDGLKTYISKHFLSFCFLFWLSFILSVFWTLSSPFGPFLPQCYFEKQL